MTPTELARSCAEQIEREWLRADREILSLSQIAERYVFGAINRALKDAQGQPAEIRHVYQGELGKVSSKLAHTTQGVSLEIDVQRPLHPGDTFEDAGRMANEVWESLYRDGAERAARLGLTLGPKPKAEGAK